MAEFSETTTKTVNCPDCASGHVVKIGKQSGEQRYLCRGCATKFRANGKAKGRRIPAEWIGAAIRQYYSGMSYKQIAEYMEDAYDIPEPSKATIYEWVRDYTQAAMEESEKYPAHTSDNWVVDEMVLDVGGDKYWNWNVMDHDTRYLLASYLSSERDQKSAEAVLRKAMAASANPPKTITTDRLPSYVPAIKKYSRSRTYPIGRVGIRVEQQPFRADAGDVRDRTKTLRGLEGRESGQRYLDGWVFHYNHFKEHHGLKGGTPRKRHRSMRRSPNGRTLPEAHRPRCQSRNAKRLKRKLTSGVGCVTAGKRWTDIGEAKPSYAGSPSPSET